MKIAGKELVGGVGAGELLHAGVGLSFWGGVDPIDGKIIDHTHPLHKHCITDKILAIPNGRLDIGALAALTGSPNPPFFIAESRTCIPVDPGAPQCLLGPAAGGLARIPTYYFICAA